MRSTRHIYDGLVKIVAYACAAAAATPAGEALGLARVTAIEPCPPGDAAAGLWAATPGFLVSARVSRTVDEVLAITLSCAFDPIIATPDHRFYSETRSAWVPAGELRPGERLRARWGPCWITSIERRRGPTRVCDLTVAGVHAFYVGEGGAAGHNGGKCGTYAPRRALPSRTQTPWDPGALGSPHTQLGRARSGYVQGREYDASGRRVRDVDFTDHGRPDRHPNPHQHRWDPLLGRLDPEPLINPAPPGWWMKQYQSPLPNPNVPETQAAFPILTFVGPACGQ